MDDAQKEPRYQKMIETILAELFTLTHQDQVIAFKEIQKRLTDFRIKQNVEMMQEISARTEDAKAHADGTSTITSELQLTF